MVNILQICLHIKIKIDQKSGSFVVIYSNNCARKKTSAKSFCSAFKKCIVLRTTSLVIMFILSFFRQMFQKGPSTRDLF